MDQKQGFARRLSDRNSAEGGSDSRSAGSQLRRRRCARAMAAATILLSAAAPAHARPTRIVWSTYLRTGPGSGYAVLDELQHHTLVDLRACSAHWCQILAGRTVGYVDRDAIALPRLARGGAPLGGSQGCFVTGQYAWRGPAKTRFCETKAIK